MRGVGSAIKEFPEHTLQRIESRLDLLQASYYSGLFSGGGIALVLALIFHFLSRHKPRT